jgi:hypothetical protein
MTSLAKKLPLGDEEAFKALESLPNTDAVFSEALAHLRQRITVLQENEKGLWECGRIRILTKKKEEDITGMLYYITGMIGVIRPSDERVLRTAINAMFMDEAQFNALEVDAAYMLLIGPKVTK